jgi:biotin transport system permease protein/energy-coupling factor transport system permease protein
MVSNTVFRYKTIKGYLHKVPALIKLILLLPLSVFCMSLPSLWLCAGIFLIFLAAFFFGLSLREQLTDVKPAFYYALLMYALSVFSNFIKNFKLIPVNELLINMLIPHPDFLQITLRLTLIVQISALLFRTTSPLEIREAVRLEIISLFLCFIPEIFKTWTSINLAWKSRGGGQGFYKIKTLTFVLITLSFERAAVKVKALQARS